jgi:response regulator of citrate/malate metabolism
MKPSVLVVDDEKDIREICHGIIARSFQCDITSCSSFADAADAIALNKIDVAVLDVHLQDGIGFDLIPLLRAQNPSVKIMIITAYSQCSEVEKANKLSVDHLLGKPFTASQFKQALEPWL